MRLVVGVRPVGRPLGLRRPFDSNRANVRPVHGPLVRPPGTSPRSRPHDHREASDERRDRIRRGAGRRPRPERGEGRGPRRHDQGRRPRRGQEPRRSRSHIDQRPIAAARVQDRRVLQVPVHRGEEEEGQEEGVQDDRGEGGQDVVQDRQARLRGPAEERVEVHPAGESGQVHRPVPRAGDSARAARQGSPRTARRGHDQDLHHGK
mmetsp:Transcript_29377/g.87106  ORF Transcript_29377/g.87106 Transcript_29377/m.87106 type:complete len:206 (-) Transcript_29377:875-1492(-)